MTRNQTLQAAYQHGSVQDPETFDRWLKANAVIATIFAAALAGMALGGSKAGPVQAIAGSAQASELGAAPGEPRGVLSPYELTIRIAPDRLPVQQVDQPF
jgi:hypothetical protein